MYPLIQCTEKGTSPLEFLQKMHKQSNHEKIRYTQIEEHSQTNWPIHFKSDKVYERQGKTERLSQMGKD